MVLSTCMCGASRVARKEGRGTAHDSERPVELLRAVELLLVVSQVAVECITPLLLVTRFALFSIHDHDRPAEPRRTGSGHIFHEALRQLGQAACPRYSGGRRPPIIRFSERRFVPLARMDRAHTRGYEYEL